MAMTIGIVLIAVTCLFALWIVRLAGNSIRTYDESEHESFLGK
ncbi:MULTISPECIES: hypothetical protein [Paenibacillus]|uniref:YtzI protein n=1 Tax=Paenibacillus oleatilyticus TaxID=2594886 RepID=A0ABV4V5L5_9BACL|nr:MULTISPECIES: hypothetical protein [Paenibacillus]GLI07488.1 hypothetical protein YDYSG_35180 [Paenibacillus tyrfis]GMX62471.1 hypothetical protein Elgi_22760 [Paenibacillus elgii]